jgi:hypothetical protein
MRARRVARFDSNGDVIYISRRGTYKRINLPTTAALRCGVARTNHLLEQGERATELFTAGKLRIPAQDGHRPTATQTDPVGPLDFQQIVAASHGGGWTWP